MGIYPLVSCVRKDCKTSFLVKRAVNFEAKGDMKSVQFVYKLQSATNQAMFVENYSLSHLSHPFSKDSRSNSYFLH